MRQYISSRTISALFAGPVLLYCTYNTALLKSPKKYGLNLLIFGNFRPLRTFVLFFFYLYLYKNKKKNLKKILPSLGNFAQVWVDMVIRQQSPTRHTAVRAGGISKMTENRSGTHAQRIRYLPGKLPVVEKICSNLLFLLPRSPSAGARFGTHVQVHAIILLKVGVRGVRSGPKREKGPRVSRRKAPSLLFNIGFLVTVAWNALPSRGGRQACI